MEIKRDYAHFCPASTGPMGIFEGRIVRAPLFLDFLLTLGYNGNTIPAVGPHGRCGGVFMCEEAVYDVVALGELLIDFTPVSTDGAGCPTLKANPGGAPGNLLAALSRYGRRHRLSGQGGRGCLRPPPSGVPAPGWSPDPGHPPHLLRLHHSGLCHPGCRGDRSFSFARKPGADTQLRWEEVDRSLIQRCRLFHFGSLSLTDEPARSATRAAVAYARELGRTVTFDPNLRLPLWPSPRRPGPDPVEPVSGGCGQAQR